MTEQDLRNILLNQQGEIVAEVEATTAAYKKREMMLIVVLVAAVISIYALLK